MAWFKRQEKTYDFVTRDGRKSFVRSTRNFLNSILIIIIGYALFGYAATAVRFFIEFVVMAMVSNINPIGALFPVSLRRFVVKLLTKFSPDGSWTAENVFEDFIGVDDGGKYVESEDPSAWFRRLLTNFLMLVGLLIVVVTLYYSFLKFGLFKFGGGSFFSGLTFSKDSGVGNNNAAPSNVNSNVPSSVNTVPEPSATANVNTVSDNTSTEDNNDNDAVVFKRLNGKKPFIITRNADGHFSTTRNADGYFSTGGDYRKKVIAIDTSKMGLVHTRLDKEGNIKPEDISNLIIRPVHLYDHYYKPRNLDLVNNNNNAAPSNVNSNVPSSVNTVPEPSATANVNTVSDKVGRNAKAEDVNKNVVGNMIEVDKSINDKPFPKPTHLIPEDKRYLLEAHKSTYNWRYVLDYHKVHKFHAFGNGIRYPDRFVYPGDNLYGNVVRIPGAVPYGNKLADLHGHFTWKVPHSYMPKIPYTAPDIWDNSKGNPKPYPRERWAEWQGVISRKDIFRSLRLTEKLLPGLGFVHDKELEICFHQPKYFWMPQRLSPEVIQYRKDMEPILAKLGVLDPTTVRTPGQKIMAFFEREEPWILKYRDLESNADFRTWRARHFEPKMEEFFTKEGDVKPKWWVYKNTTQLTPEEGVAQEMHDYHTSNTSVDNLPRWYRKDELNYEVFLATLGIEMNSPLTAEDRDEFMDLIITNGIGRMDDVQEATDTSVNDYNILKNKAVLRLKSQCDLEAKIALENSESKSWWTRKKILLESQQKFESAYKRIDYNFESKIAKEKDINKVFKENMELIMTKNIDLLDKAKTAEEAVVILRVYNAELYYFLTHYPKVDPERLQDTNLVKRTPSGVVVSYIQRMPEGYLQEDVKEENEEDEDKPKFQKRVGMVNYK